MKKFILLAALPFFFAACEKNNGTNEGNGSDVLTGTITEDLTLEEGREYKLSGGLHVQAPATLTIEPGVTITAVYDDVTDYILIEQGAKINAQGTASNPIVMTAEVKEDGAWGGLLICGRATSNVEGGTGLSEIGNAPYGGNDDNDNSGVLKYVRLEYTGWALDEEHESNGISFYGVGRGTQVSYCQAYMGADDGFEFFGGSVNAKYLVVTDCEDDSFDWTEGWNGKAQFLVATQKGTSGEKDDGDCLIEADNQDTNNEAKPISWPTLSNLTLIGNKSTAGDRGIRLREGTYAKIYNAIITGKPRCLTTETSYTEESLIKGESILMYMTLESDIDCEESIYSSALFTATDNHNEINATIPNFSNVFVGTIADGYDLSAEDDFFTAAAYRGAVEADDDWTAGWTAKE